MSIVDDRFDNAMEAIKHNHDDIRSSVVLFNNKVNDIQESLESLTGLLIDQLEQVAVINTQVEELKLGVLSLVNGKLSPLLVKPNILKQTIHYLSKLLASKYDTFRLLQREP
jgi:hypothetical protein